MAKVGYEVEGRLQGLHTLFIDAYEWIHHWSKSKEEMKRLNIAQVYISDHEGIVNWKVYEDEFQDLQADGIIVTFELTNLLEEPTDFEVMLFIDGSTDMASIKYLRPNDQIKLEHQRFCLVAPVGTMYVTLPEDFEGDVEL